MVIVAAVIAIGTSVGISIALHLQSWYGDAEARSVLEFITSLVIYFLPFVVLIAFIWSFASFSVIKEKVNGNIECLIATPLSPGELLIGKGLAVFLPGYMISFITLGVVLITINLSVYLPGWNTIILPGSSLVLGLVINPMLFLSILFITLILSLANNPDIAMTPSFLIGFGLMIGIPVCLGTGSVDFTSWSFALWYLLGVAIVLLVMLYTSKSLTRQNIVLSSKGS